MHGLKPPDAAELVERLRAIAEERPATAHHGARERRGATPRGGDDGHGQGQGHGFQLPGQPSDVPGATPATSVAGVRATTEGLDLGAPDEALLGAGVVVELPSAPELALRAVVADVRQALLGLEKESDPLVRALGLRSLAEELHRRDFVPERLERPDDRAFARQLVEGLHGGLRQCLAGLDAQARVDLATLEGAERARRAAAEAAERRREATAACEERRESAKRAAEEEALVAARLEREVREGVPKPQARRRAGGVALFVVGVLSLLVVAALVVAGAATEAPKPARHPALGGPGLWALAGLVAVAFGARLWDDPARRLARRRARAQRLRGASHERAARLDEAQRELERALALFARVDEECRREEAAAAAVLQRRPGAARYVGASRSAGGSSTALARR